jgi:hypothetical protein
MQLPRPRIDGSRNAAGSAAVILCVDARGPDRRACARPTHCICAQAGAAGVRRPSAPRARGSFRCDGSGHGDRPDRPRAPGRARHGRSRDVQREVRCPLARVWSGLRSDRARSIRADRASHLRRRTHLRATPAGLKRDGAVAPLPEPESGETRAAARTKREGRLAAALPSLRQGRRVLGSAALRNLGQARCLECSARTPR